MVNLLQEAGAAKVAFTDLSRDDMAEASEDAFRYDSLVLCAASYDGGVFPPMEDFLNRLSHKAFQKRKVGIIENGSWAPTSARGMQKLLEPLNWETAADTVALRSALRQGQQEDLERMAMQLAESVKA